MRTLFCIAIPTADCGSYVAQASCYHCSEFDSSRITTCYRAAKILYFNPNTSFSHKTAKYGTLYFVIEIPLKSILYNTESTWDVNVLKGDKEQVLSNLQRYKAQCRQTISFSNHHRWASSRRFHVSSNVTIASMACIH